MKLGFAEIPRGISRYTIDDCSWFPAKEAGYSLSVVAQIRLNKQDDEDVVVDGTLRGTRHTVCDRCGEPIEVDLQCDFEYLVTTRKEEHLDAVERECSEVDASTFYLDAPVIDIGGILREQVFLSVPFRTLCSENCKGICAGCGVVLNNDTCCCSHGGSESPFSVLGKLTGGSNKE